MMAVLVPRGPGVEADSKLRAITEKLDAYQQDHPSSVIEVYRHSPYVVRIRIVDDAFRGKSRVERHRMAWNYLATLDDETLSDVSLLLLLTPSERSTSMVNVEFDDPIPSRF